MRHQPRMSVALRLGITVFIAALCLAGCTTNSTTAAFVQVQITSTSGSLGQGAANAVFPPAQLSGSGGIGGLTFSVTQGALPTGLTLNPSGALSGTPTQSGVFNFTVTATDQEGHTASAAFSVTINPSISSVTTSSGSVPGGTSATGTVTLASAALFAATVTLSSNSTSATVPASVTLATGATTANFNITTTVVTTSTPVTITATYGATKTTGFAVNPPGSLSVQVTNTPVNFSQGDTGDVYQVYVLNAGNALPTVGAVTLTDVPASGLTVTSMAGGSGSLWVCTFATLSCTRSDALVPGNTWDPIYVTVNVALNASSPQISQLKLSGGGSPAATGIAYTYVEKPALSITKSHTGSFQAGQTGATYTLAVSNAAGTVGYTTGAVTVTEIPPTGLTVTGLAGGGGSLWVCNVGTLSCTRSDRLAPGASYDPITVTANIAGGAPASLTNQASLSGGNSAAPPNASDVTTIVQPSLSITKTHTGGNFTQGEQGAQYTINVTNGTAASPPTSGIITVVDTPPTGFTVTSIVGVGGGTPWSCVLGTLTCASTRALAGGESDPITVTGNVSLSATAPFQNTATLSGGGGITPAPAVDTMSALNPQLQITTTNATLATGTDGTAYSTSLVATGGTGGYTWSFTGGTNLVAANLGLAANGTISGTPGAYGAFPFSVQVQDTQGNTQTANLTLNVNPPPLTVTTTPNSLPSVTVNSVYPGGVMLGASGGIAPYTWALVSGPTTFPAGIGLVSNGAISGTATAAGFYTFTVQVTDSSTPTPLTKTATLNISVNPAYACPMSALGNEGLLSGNFVALFDGFQDANGPVRATFAFGANGSGNITGGEGDLGAVLSYTGGAYQNPIAPIEFTLTGGCYQLGADNRGVMIWNVSGGGAITFVFSVRNDGELGRFIEFQDPSPSATGIETRGAGEFRLQTVSSFSLASLNGPFAFGMTGYINDNCTATQQANCTGTDKGYQRIATVGQFTSNGTGGLTSFVFNVAQASSGAQQNVDGVTTTSASYTAPDTFGRGTITISGTNPGIGGAFTFDYSYYVIDANDVYMQAIDNPTHIPLFNGLATAQSGSFSAASLTGTAFLSMTGGDLAGNAFTAIAAGQASGNGSGTGVSTLLDKIVDGATISSGTTAITGGTFSAAPNGMGVLTIGSGGAAQAFSVALTGTNAGFLLEGTQASPGTNVMAGAIQPQTAPGGGFGNSAASGLFVEGSAVPTTTTSTVETGTVTLNPAATPSPTVTGTKDTSGGLTCTACLVVGNPINGTYSIDTNGRISVTTTDGTIFGWMRDTSHGVLLNTQTDGLTTQLDH
jgi:hypothetical protein